MTGLRTLRQANAFCFSRLRQEPVVRFEDALELEEHKTQLHDPSYLLDARRDEKGTYVLPKRLSDDEYLKMMGELSRHQRPEQGAPERLLRGGAQQGGVPRLQRGDVRVR